jgi:hypothetical protein
MRGEDVANLVGRMTQRLSNMKAMVFSILCGFSSVATARS